MCNQPDELTVYDWRALDSRWERECQAVEDIHAECAARPARIAFDLVDDVWNFNLDDIFRMHNREANSWEILRDRTGWSYFSTNPFAEIIRFAGPDFSVEHLQSAFSDIYKKCPDNYQLNRYFSALINYMIRKKAWIDNRKVVRVTQRRGGIRTEDIEHRQDNRSRLDREKEMREFKEECCEILANLIEASNTCVDQLGDVIEGCFVKYVGLGDQYNAKSDAIGHARLWMALRLHQWKMRIIEDRIQYYQNQGLLSDRAEKEMVELKRIIINHLAYSKDSDKYGIARNELANPKQAENYQDQVPPQLLEDVKRRMTKDNALDYMVDVIGTPWIRGEITGANDMCLEWVKDFSRALMIDELSDVDLTSLDQGQSEILMADDQSEITRLKRVNRQRMDQFLDRMGDLGTNHLTPTGVIYILQRLGIVQSVSPHLEHGFR
ncbi:hypothetical protein GCM10023116_17540 [Kistimonas scapharcae]|uniref:Uncharacterized protein n=2 Tax=Kistimonas scapharcae TaxID=1036133 RepID=A0ABP8V2E4_9GAMM